MPLCFDYVSNLRRNKLQFVAVKIWDVRIMHFVSLFLVQCYMPDVGTNIRNCMNSLYDNWNVGLFRDQDYKSCDQGY